MTQKPTLIAFDLDYTLWPFWIDTHVDPPFKIDSKGLVRDTRQKHVTHYADVPQILESLRQQNYLLAIVSKTSCTEEARQLVDLFKWMHYFVDVQIYPGDKRIHFERIQKKTGVAYSDMLFFDDEQPNITAVSKLGVTCVLVKNGMNLQLLEEGLKRFAKNK